MWTKPVIKAMKRNSRVPQGRIVGDKGGISYGLAEQRVFSGRWHSNRVEVWGREFRADGMAVNEDNDW